MQVMIYCLWCAWSSCRVQLQFYHFWPWSLSRHVSSTKWCFRLAKPWSSSGFPWLMITSWSSSSLWSSWSPDRQGSNPWVGDQVMIIMRPSIIMQSRAYHRAMIIIKPWSVIKSWVIIRVSWTSSRHDNWGMQVMIMIKSWSALQVCVHDQAMFQWFRHGHHASHDHNRVMIIIDCMTLSSRLMIIIKSWVIIESLSLSHYHLPSHD